MSKIQAFTALGARLKEYFSIGEKAPIYPRMEAARERASLHNAWFDRDNCLFALQHWAEFLTQEQLQRWLSAYSFEGKTPKRVALILAGNIPMVGFHDLLCVI